MRDLRVPSVTLRSGRLSRLSTSRLVRAASRATPSLVTLWQPRSDSDSNPGSPASRAQPESVMLSHISVPASGASEARPLSVIFRHQARKLAEPGICHLNASADVEARELGEVAAHQVHPQVRHVNALREVEIFQPRQAREGCQAIVRDIVDYHSVVAAEVERGEARHVTAYYCQAVGCDLLCCVAEVERAKVGKYSCEDGRLQP
eukprot:scaffold266387_cov48-Prasinocladus_malaysianus.AAC.1